MQDALNAFVLFAGLGGAFGLLLGLVSRRFPADPSALVARIDACLPQTQCAQCGYPGCRPYATAIAENIAAIDQCPPGGQATIDALAELLGDRNGGVNPAFGLASAPAVAVIDERECIGCTLCLDACPVDAIIGGSRLMHTVLARECTGCELCLAPCPVDCIEMAPPPVWVSG